MFYFKSKSKKNLVAKVASKPEFLVAKEKMLVAYHTEFFHNPKEKIAPPTHPPSSVKKSSSPPCSIHNECSLKNLMHDDFTCVFSIPVKFEICFLGLPKDLFFGVISYNLLHL